MMKSVKFAAVGGPEVLELVVGVMPVPGPGEVLLRQTAVGLILLIPTIGPGCIRCHCPLASAWRALASLRRLGLACR